MNDLTIRLEDPGNIDAIRRVNMAAFDTPAEAHLIDALRTSVDPFLSFVALLKNEVVGHILLTPVTVHHDEREPWRALALGPMAVLPSHQNQGIGSALVRFGLAHCKANNHNVIFVLGHPNFYPRFGFEPAPPRGLACTWNVPDDIFMVTELAPGAIAGRTGLVRYHALFESM